MTNIKSKTEIFIEKAIEIHGNKYDYSHVNYLKNNVKVNIICTKHGSFFQIPSSHLQGKGCIKCFKFRATDNFEKKANEIHNGTYNYSLVEYVNTKTPIEIICRIHGVFQQTPEVHYKGAGCPKCYAIRRKYNTEIFIQKAIDVHGDKYDYSQSVYTHNRNKIKIICNEHGIFFQIPTYHLQGYGCSKCGIIKYSQSNTKTTEIFINEANKIHNKKYDYSFVEYIGDAIKVKIKCQKHGIFTQCPSNHLQGHDCPKCKHNQFSKKQIQWLEYIAKKENIYIQHAMNDGEYKINNYKVDGYCKETNTVYEYNGCFWHGCVQCFNRYELNVKNKQTFGDLYIKTLERQIYIEKQGYRVVTMWDHEWKEQQKQQKTY